MSNESEHVAGYVPSAGAVEAGARAICIRQGGEPDFMVSGALVKVPDFPQWAEYAGEATAALSAAVPVEVARLQERINVLETELATPSAASTQYVKAIERRTAERNEGRRLLGEVRAEIDSWQHATVEDCWYSCGLTHGTDHDDACWRDAKAGDCTCGLNYRRDRLRAVLDAVGATAQVDEAATGGECAFTGLDPCPWHPDGGNHPATGGES